MLHISMHILTSWSLLSRKNNDKGDFLAFHLKEIDYAVTIRLKTKTIIVGICVCRMRTADVSPRSSPLNEDVSRGGTKRPSAAMNEEKRLPFAGYCMCSL